MLHTNHAIGICLGASNIKVVTGHTEGQNFIPVEQAVRAHNGNARDTLATVLAEYALPHSLIAVTGHKLKDQVRLPRLSELEATELALAYLNSQLPPVDAVVSGGGENVMVYELDKNGRIVTAHTGNKCASGTGEFFLQQIRRMNLGPDQAQGAAEQGAPYKISSRCSVFSKSDCTHALNKGTPKGRVVAGLCHMVAAKITELLRATRAKNVLLIGGMAKNRVVVEYLRADGFNMVPTVYADTFEALGTALWAQEHGSPLNHGQLFAPAASSFEFLAPLTASQRQVTFKAHPWGVPTPGDDYIIGLDAGSTTTKAVLLRTHDRSIVAGVYLRTNGDPVQASRQCYRSLAQQVPAAINIIGLGVTGSGRQIVGLHGMTRGIVNEIIAHNTAAVFFDPEVDTIFEIGGQDAKYTYTTNGVPADYAMNEACSAGTGSFLEESARDTLNISTEDIASYALRATRPPNFNDQCAAFIGSDIKTAIQEGITTEDIAAGLVYAICLNYLTRVKGSRKVGSKIFMQGGVCYNEAVPLAMATLTKRQIIVPPDPGLMGAFGVALEVLAKMEDQLLPRGNFSLVDLAAREAKYGRPFPCQGGQERCDRKCIIARLTVDGKTYPFGGACNKYYNERVEVSHNVAELDLVAVREKLLYDRPLFPGNPNGKTVGISPALMTNSLYPLYHAFLTELGFAIILSDAVSQQGVERRRAPFCYPVDMAHGLMMNLIGKQPDYILLPHVRATPVKNGAFPSTTCPLIQSEPYVLKRTFQGDLGGLPVLAPVLNMPNSYQEGEPAMVQLGTTLGATASAARKAFSRAVEVQTQFAEQLKKTGQEALAYAARLQLPTVVLFGRSYNALLGMANMGIPNKFASRGVMVIPFDMIDVDGDPPIATMHWAAGMGILKAAQAVKRHPRLFGCYITNFSCGPDSFVINFFREQMGDKPSLTLELDSHTADAGLDTRIEALLDIIKSFGRKAGSVLPGVSPFRPAELIKNGREWSYRSSAGETFPLRNGRVKLLIPAMGDFGARIVTAAFRHAGFNTVTLPPPTEADLQRGKEHSTCKECLPLALTLGTLYHYLDQRPQDELSVYFMPSTGGSCRFAQYNVLVRLLINQQRIPNLAVMSLTSQNSYGGLGLGFTLRGLWATTIGDVMEEIRAAVLTLSANRDEALKVHAQTENMLIDAVASQRWSGLVKTLKAAAAMLAAIPLHTPLAKAPKVALIGEIYVRRDGFSQRYLLEHMAEKGIVALAAPVAEWVYYTNYLALHGLRGKTSLLKRLQCRGKAMMMEHYEKAIKDILVKSGLYDYHLLDINRLINSVAGLISPQLTGEAILTLACALNDVIDRVDGVISIGPFGCMPSRIAEAMIKQTIDTEKVNICHDPELVRKVVANHPHLPFISIESDGSPFPPVIAAGLESFVLQAKRVHQTRWQA